MSSIAPDIPELDYVPQVVRPLIWMRALMRAVRQPQTWLLGLVLLMAAAGGCGLAGFRILGWVGATIGGLLGSGAAIYGFFQLLLPSQARRCLPIVTGEVDWQFEFRDLIAANDRLQRVASSVTSSAARGRDLRH